MNLHKMKTKEIAQLIQQTSEPALSDLLIHLQQDQRRSVQTLAERCKKNLERQRQERLRIAAMWTYELQAKEKGYQWIAGTDEVGRGPLAGPVVAAAVILPSHADLPDIKDSKKLTEKQRESINILIQEQAIAWTIAEVDEKVIDKINILEASRLAMKKAVMALSQPVDFVLVDGLPNPQIHLPAQAIIKGDNKSISIAAAAIIAKVYRDHLMEQYDNEYPGYGFAENKGYPTEAHLKAIEAQGPCPIHRMSFRPLNQEK